MSKRFCFCRCVRPVATHLFCPPLLYGKSISEAAEERFHRQCRELLNRYWPFCRIDAEGRYSSIALERPFGAEAVEPWIDAITGLSEAVLREDLEKAEDMVNLNFKFDFCLDPWFKALLETLKGELLPQRLTALASLRQTGIPEATEVLGLLLRELWARITGGHSKLCDQETAHLQRLLDLMQKAERVKNSQQIEWCGHFCGPIWALQQSGGEGPPDPVDYDVALEELRDLVEKVQKILTSRQLPVGLIELKDVTMSLKEDLKELQQDKLQMKEELEKLTSEHDKSKCRMTEMDDKLKKMEHESSAEKELLNMKKDLREVCMKYGCLTFNGNLKRKRGLGEEKRHQNEEASILSSASSGFSVDTGGPCCFMVDAVFETPTGSFLSGLQLCLSWKCIRGPALVQDPDAPLAPLVLKL